MFNISLEDIDIYKIGQWPFYLKAILIVVNGALVYFACNWLFISGKAESLQNLKDEETRLRTFFAAKQKQLINVEDYKSQVGQIESRLAKLVKKLPEANELPNLINQISQAGNDSGLFFKEIKVQPEKKFKYYVELPISITVDGDYHQIGDFVSKVSGMSRVITFHDFKLERDKDLVKGEKQKLSLSILAKTYRYLVIERKDEADDQPGPDGKPVKQNDPTVGDGNAASQDGQTGGDGDAAKI